MNDLEKQIEEAAKLHVGLDVDLDTNDQKVRYFRGLECDRCDDFMTGAKSNAAKALHTKGMYSEEEVLELVESALFEVGYEIDVDTYPDGTTWSVGELKSWFEQNKKR